MPGVQTQKMAASQAEFISILAGTRSKKTVSLIP